MEDIRLPRHVIDRLRASLGEPAATGREGLERRQKQTHAGP